MRGIVWFPVEPYLPTEEAQVKLYGAGDLHSNNCVVSLLNEQDKVVYERRLPNKLSVILDALAPYREQLESFAIESTYNWYWLVDGLQEAGFHVVLVNTAAVKVYEGLKNTDDKHDARHLAQLLRLGILPQGYIYPKEERAVRDLLRKRSQLVRQRTAQVLSIQNLWSRNTGRCLSSDEVKQNTEPTASLERNRALAIQSSQAMVACFDEQIEMLERTILKQVRPRKDWTRLLTVPGVGQILGLTILLEAGDMTRFEKAGHFASYCRCVRSQNLSNGKKKGEGNRKNGNRYLGWAFMEAANFAIRYYDEVKRFYQRKKSTTNRIVALKAIAHKLSKASYHVLRDQVAFDMTKAFA